MGEGESVASQSRSFRSKASRRTAILPPLDDEQVISPRWEEASLNLDSSPCHRNGRAMTYLAIITCRFLSPTIKIHTEGNSFQLSRETHS
jgi:hypothetical protein